MERGVERWQLIDLTRYGLVPISRQRRQRRDFSPWPAADAQPDA
jgi:hypothetical protein